MTRQDENFLNHCCEAISSFREKRPHVHCITNHAAQNFTANVLLAAGGKASMTVSTDEIEAFVSMADALLVNLGTLDDERRKSAVLAMQQAKAAGKPSVLDPVFVHGSPSRLAFASELLALQPTLIRANKVEANALRAVEPNSTESLFVITGSEDRICTTPQIHCGNGSPLMDRITAMGCSLSALMAGFLTVTLRVDVAAGGTLLLFNVAGEVAQEWSEGPGTFQPLFLDALANLSIEQIRRKAKLA